jgi:hypothetical protein
LWQAGRRTRLVKVLSHMLHCLRAMASLYREQIPRFASTCGHRYCVVAKY